MTFGELQDEVYDDCRLDSANTDIQARVKRYINAGHRNILRRSDLKNLRNGTLSFTSVVGQAYYGFVEAFDVIQQFTQQTNDRYLIPKTLDWLRQMDPGLRMIGTPTNYVDMGWQPVFQHPASTGVWAVSTTTDTTQTVRLRGIRANGDDSPEADAVLTGTTRVQIGTITDYILIKAFTLSAAGAGTISLYDASTGGNELARLPIGVLGRRWKVGRLWPTPSAALAYTVDGQLTIAPLVNASDMPMLPEEYHDILTVYARRRVATWLGDVNRFQMADGEFREWIARLRAYSEFPPNFAPRVANRQSATGWNNLGGMYPADGDGV